MLTPPPIPTSLLLDHARETYGLPLVDLTFLPLGADASSAVYRTVSADGSAYFLKLRRDPFDPTGVAIPLLLQKSSVRAVIPILVTRTGEFWSTIAAGETGYTMVLSPFIEGTGAYQNPLTGAQWTAFGEALRAVHAVDVPPDLARQIRRETFSPQFRQMVRDLLTQVETTPYSDPTARELAAVMRQNHAEMVRVIDRAETLANDLSAGPLPFVLCHSDLHPGNLHITPSGDLYIVDWDDPILAPKERDLMFVGAGMDDSTPRQWDLFFAAYGTAPVDPALIAYYRYERIVQDFAAFCEEILRSNSGGDDRQQSLLYFKTNFQPNSTITAADRVFPGE